MRAAAALAEQHRAIATIGITPTSPATGYGYIEQGDSIGSFDNLAAFKVRRFTEKPDRATAQAFLAQNRFSWNSGIFIFPAGVALNELHTYAPDIIEPLEKHGAAIYPQLPKISIDYALMEKTDRAYVLPSNFGWDDLGDWNAIDRLLKTDQPNVEVAKHIGLDTKNSLFYAENDDELIVTIGLEDLVVVRDGNVTLIAPKSRTQDIKQVLKQIQAQPDLQDLL